MKINQFPQYPMSFFCAENILSNSEIDTILKNVKSLKSQDSKITVGKSESNDFIQNSSFRTSTIKWIPEIPPTEWLYKKLHDCILESNNTWNFTLSSIEEQIQYSEYNSTQKGHYTWHVDIANDVFALRKLSVIVQLSSSEEYEGGDVEFFTGGDIDQNKIKAIRNKGSVTVFPSYMLHRVTPVTKGIRKSLVLWVGGTQFR